MIAGGAKQNNLFLHYGIYDNSANTDESIKIISVPTNTVNINATISSLIAKGTSSPLQLSSPDKIRNTAGERLLGQQISQSLASDLDNIRTQINTLNIKAQTPPTMSSLLLTNAQGQVVAAIGDFTYQGLNYRNYYNEIHVGNPLGTRDPSQALFNANLDGSVVIGQHGWLDVHDFWGGNAAWIGTQFDTLPITGAFNNGANLIRLQVNDHPLATDNTVEVRNMQMAGVPNATGTWSITVIDANTIDLQGSVWAGSFVLPAAPGGIDTLAPTIDRVLQVTGCIQTPGGTTVRLKFSIPTGYESGTAVTVADVKGVPNATGQWITSIPATLAVTGAVDNGSGLIRLTVAGQNFATGDRPQVLNVGGVPNADGYWVVTVVDSTHVDLQGSVFDGVYTTGGTITFLNANLVDLAESPYTGSPSVFAGTYSAGGTCLEYFAGMLAQTVAVGPSFQNYKLRAFPSGDLRINNAEIQLTSASGQITLDPNSTQIILTNFTNLSSITLDATVPSLTFRDQTGTPQVTLEILQETPLAVTVATNANPVVMTVPTCVTANPSGSPYINGDTVLVQGATGNTNINGYRIIENVTNTNTFTMTDLFGSVIKGNGALAGTVTCTRYYAGLLAQSLALGLSWPGYRLRFFADGTLRISNATIDASIITNSSVTVTSFSSVGGTAPNTITLAVANGLLNITGAGTQAGKGIATFDQLGLKGQTPAPTEPGAGFADIYYETGGTPGLFYNLGGAAWLPLAGAAQTISTPTVSLQIAGSAVGITGTQTCSCIQTGKQVLLLITITLTNKGAGAGAVTLSLGTIPTVAVAGNGIVSNLANMLLLTSSVDGYLAAASTSIVLEQTGAAASAGLVDTNLTNTSSFSLVLGYQST